MKKSVLALICVLSILSGMLANVCVSAQTISYEYEENYLPKPYYREVSLYSDGVEQQLEELLVKGWGNVSEEIDIASLKIPVDDFKDLYYYLVYENPQFYYVQTGYSIYSNGKTVTAVVPLYKTTDKAEITQVTAGIEAEKQNILSQIDENMTDFAKVMTVHDYLALNYYYDTTYSNYDTSIMVTKTGVCQAYALTFKLIMNELDIPCTFVSSDEMNHAWNLVRVDGSWYHIDVTWDDPVADKFAQARHTYALLSSDRIQSLPEPHTGFDLNGLTAESAFYDDAEWHDSISAIVSIGEETYYVDRANNQIKILDGNVVVDKLAGNDGKWNIPNSGYFYSNSYASISKYDGKLIYSTDTEINELDLATLESSVLEEVAGVSGMYINKDTLYYSKLEYLGESEYGTPIITETKNEILLGGSVTPTPTPSITPTATPTAVPTATPTATPTAVPTATPTAVPTATPTAVPTAVPTATPTATPTAVPTATPTATPTAVPTATPTAAPTEEPSPSAEYEFEITDSDIKFTFINSDTHIETAVMIVALYDNGELVKIKIFDPEAIEANAVSEHTFETDGVQFDSIRAFIWEDTENLNPLFSIPLCVISNEE